MSQDTIEGYLIYDRVVVIIIEREKCVRARVFLYYTWHGMVYVY